MTKINILHVAINYIRALENILHTGDAGFNSYGTAIVQSPFMPTPQAAAAEAKEEQEAVQKSPPPPQPPQQQQQQRVKVLRPLNNVNTKPPAVHAPRNGRGLKVLHPQKAVTAVQEERRPGVTLQQPLTKIPGDLTPTKSFEDEAFSGSEDSGIVDSDEGGGGGIDCPDWTELTSTLEFPKRGSLDTMLTTTATAAAAVTSAVASQVVVARQVSFPELDSDPGADLFGDILCEEDGGGSRMDHDGGGCYVGKSLFDISDNFPLIM